MDKESELCKLPVEHHTANFHIILYNMYEIKWF